MGTTQKLETDDNETTSSTRLGLRELIHAHPQQAKVFGALLLLLTFLGIWFFFMQHEYLKTMIPAEILQDLKD